MIVTVTANTLINQSLFIHDFEKNTVLRSHKTLYGMGAKPTDASWLLAPHGIKSLAMGFSAGVTGDKMEQMLTERGIDIDFVRVGGETRMAIALMMEADNTETTITPDTLEIEPHHIKELFKRVEKVLPKATVVVMGGSLPRGMTPNFYTDLIKLVKKYEVTTVMDAKPDNLRAGLKAGIDYIKPNQVEMSGLYDKDINTIEDAYEAGKWALETYDTSSVISMGAQGALAVLPDASYHVKPIPIKVASAVGAGDSILAGIAAALHQGKPMTEGLRLGAATATAVCIHPNTAEFHMEDAQRFMEQIEIVPYP